MKTNLSGCQFQKQPRRQRIPLLQNPRMQCGILTSGGDKTYSHRTGGPVAHFKSARAGDKHDRSRLLPEFKKGETKFQ